MDWTLAIDRNREALLRLVAMLCAAAGLSDERAAPVVVPRRVHWLLLRSLRPVEAALRRLVVVIALRMVVRLPSPSPAPLGLIRRGSAAERVPAFPLFDPRKRFLSSGQRRPRGAGPRITVIGSADPVFMPERTVSPDDPMSAARLFRRLQAVQRVLDDLPRQARRFARWKARTEAARQQEPNTPRRVWPFRPGRPPGYRARGREAVDEILSDCHLLALWALKPPDTS